MTVKAMPMRSDERIKRLCRGAVNLAELSLNKKMPPELIQALNNALDNSMKRVALSEHELFPTILNNARRKVKTVEITEDIKYTPGELEEVKYRKSTELWNCLLGGTRQGLGIGELSAENLQEGLCKEMECFLESEKESNQNLEDARKEEIYFQAKKSISWKYKHARGLHVSFNHWTDLALEMWGDAIEKDNENFSIELMIIGKDAYNVNGMKNALLHCYYDAIPTWRNLWIQYFKNKGGNLSYLHYSGQKIGEIDDKSEVGLKMIQLKIWPTNAVPYLRAGDLDAVGDLPRLLKEDDISIALLAYQIWLLHPKRILVLGGGENGMTNSLTKAALKILGKNFSKIEIKVIPHPSHSKIWSCDTVASFIDN